MSALKNVFEPHLWEQENVCSENPDDARSGLASLINFENIPERTIEALIDLFVTEREIDDQGVSVRTEESVGNKKLSIYFYASIVFQQQKKDWTKGKSYFNN